MRKFLLVLAVSLCLVALLIGGMIAGLVFFPDSALMRAFKTTPGITNFFYSGIMRTFNVTVSVDEGSVEVWDLTGDRGKRFLRVVSAGETFSFIRQVPAGTPGIFNLLKPVIPQAAKIYTEQMAKLTEDADEDEFTRTFTEEEFKQYIIPELEQRTDLKEIEVRIDETGFSGTATFAAAGLPVTVRGSGIVTLDVSTPGALSLALDQAELGPLKMPRALRRQIETAFTEILEASDLDVEIVEMSYTKDGIIINFRRKEK